jgi:hypothetical protein
VAVGEEAVLGKEVALGEDTIRARSGGRFRRKTRSECTVKKAKICFLRDDQTRWSPDRTWWGSVRSESSKLLERPDTFG